MSELHNPWAHRWATAFAGFNSRIEQRLMEVEAKQAEAEGSYPCPKPGCSGQCWYRPGVGGWWCDTCQQLDR